MTMRRAWSARANGEEPRLLHARASAKNGTENSMRSAISVAASTPCRYASLTTIAFAENSTLPAMASARPVRNRRRVGVDTQRFYGRDRHHRLERHAAHARHTHPARKATPPKGVIEPSERSPVSASRYRLPLKRTMPAMKSTPA